MSSFQLPEWFMLRAECKHDVQRFFEKAGIGEHIEYAMYIEIGGIRRQIPDVTVEFKSTIPLATLKDIARSMDDLHVLEETLQLRKDYTGKRNPNPNPNPNWFWPRGLSNLW